MSFIEVQGGTEYEKYSKQVYEKILEKQGAKLRNCKHDIKLPGSSGQEHQIDVYFEMEVDGQWKKFAIECKNYSSRVEIGRMRDFWGVIEDVGDINGIFIAKSGYQIGARKYGTFKDISLKELRLPEDRDWDGRVKSIILDVSIPDIRVVKREYKIDDEWVISNLETIRAHFKQDQFNISVSFTSKDKVFLNEKLIPVASIEDVEREIYHIRDRAVGNEIHEFDISDYFMSAQDGFPFKMKTLKSHVQVHEPWVQKIRVESEVDCILKDIKSGDIDFITKN